MSQPVYRSGRLPRPMIQLWPTLALSVTGVIIVLAGLLSPYAVVEGGGALSAFEVGYAERSVVLTGPLFFCLALAAFRSTRRLALVACIAITALAAYLAVVAYYNVSEIIGVEMGLDADSGPATLIVGLGQLLVGAAVFALPGPRESDS